MSVIKTSHSIDDLRYRIVLLNKLLKEDHDGEPLTIYKEIGMAWARIKQISHFRKKISNKNIKFLENREQKKYFFVMRKNNNRNARHAEVNALRWNNKILDIIYPFCSDESECWIEGVAVEINKEN